MPDYLLEADVAKLMGEMMKAEENKLVMPNDGGTGERMLQWFSTEHLPHELAECVQLYRCLAMIVAKDIPAGPERTVALRKLVESKDCAVRAIIEGRNNKTVTA